MIFLMAVYTMFKVDVMLNYKDIVIQTPKIEQYFTEDYIYSG